MPGMTDRDTFAVAALTGLLARGLLQSNLLAADAYKVADAMLRERCRRDGDCAGSDNAANHDAAPAAIVPEPEPSAARRRPAGGTGKTNHDAAPAATASIDSVAPQPTTHGDSDRTDKAAPRPSEGTGDTPKPISGCVSDRPTPITGPDPDSRVWETPVHTPAPHATPGEGSVPRECTEPVAWAVMPSNSDYCVTLSTRKEAAKKAAERKVEVGEYATMDDIVIVPLYRHPPCQDVSQKNLTLTDRERGAIERAVDSIASTMPYESQQGAADWKTLRGLLVRLGGER